MEHKFYTVLAFYTLTENGNCEYSSRGPLGDAMAPSRELFRTASAVVLSFSLTATTIHGASTTGVGLVESAERAQVGRTVASVGATIFNGDSLSTDRPGSLQVRAGAARLVLASGSRMVWGAEEGLPAATLNAGSATFSTANSKAFALRAGTAVVRPTGDEPSVGSVAVLNPKELTIHCSRGSLTMTVIDDSLVIPEGTSYHIVLNPDDKAADDPKAWGGNQRPKTSGRNRFLYFLIIAVGVGAAIGIHYALESPERP